MLFSFNTKNNIPVYTLEGKIFTENQTAEFKAEVENKISEGFNRFVFDLSKITFVNSAGLNFLLSVLTKVRLAEGDVMICSVPEQMRKLLVITKLESFFPIAANADLAIAQMNK